ncbi:hypothetical protein H0H87_008053 [Tephrocybe sp. NHM501043]|nr:hypothetical protein H0H87_008053 [Tephrocybe sp. NHM501043]
MQAVRDMGLRTGKGKGLKEIGLECQVGCCRCEDQTSIHVMIHEKKGSSLGIYTTQWFNEFHWSARGESAEEWLDQPKKRREKLPYPPIKVVYPTKATVQQTILGEQMIIATRQEASKAKLAAGSDTEDDSDDDIEVIETAIGWAYIGSHNFTPSAWGTLSGSAFNPILNVSGKIIPSTTWCRLKACLSLPDIKL